MPAAPSGDLVLDHRHLVRSVVLRICGRLDADLIGTGYLALVLSAARFDPSRGVPFGAFARERIEWAVQDRMRYERRRAHEPLSDRQGDDSENLALKLDIQRAIETLPPRQRLILHLRFWRGLEIEEAARRAGCSRATAIVERRTALQALRQRLSSAGSSLERLVKFN